jgi:putative transposase
MKITRAYKTELDPTNKQVTHFIGSCGMARFVYNWALDYWIKEHERGERRTGWMKLNTKLTELKQTEFTWMYDYSNWIRTYAMKQCDDAYQNFFRRVKSGEKPGFPKFKSKKFSEMSYTVNGSEVQITEIAIKLPKIGWVRLKEHGYIPVKPDKICYATISEKNGHWYVSVTVNETIPDQSEPKHVIGIDLGIKTLAVTSDGVYYENPKELYKAEKKLKRLDRLLSRKENGSSNYKKAKLLRAKAYEKVMRIRKHVLNEITTELAKTKSVLVVEDLNVSGMMQNHHLARAISDVSFFEFRRQLEYKCAWYGSELAVIDRWYPSSKMCSRCGAINDDLKLSDRVYKCDCGLEIDRDLNAAINIRNYYTAKHAEIDACGQSRKTGRIPSAVWLKQEASGELVNA